LVVGQLEIHISPVWVTGVGAAQAPREERTQMGSTN
jgi:hypothetical protein